MGWVLKIRVFAILDIIKVPWSAQLKKIFLKYFTGFFFQFGGQSTLKITKKWIKCPKRFCFGVPARDHHYFFGTTCVSKHHNNVHKNKKTESRFFS